MSRLPRFLRRKRVVGAAAAVLALPLLLLVPLPVASAEPAATSPTIDTRFLDTSKTFTLDGQPVEVPKSYQSAARRTARAAVTSAAPVVGTTRWMLALDDELGRIYFKPYTLQGIGDKIEVWVADNLQFPSGDCRGTVSVTSDQVQELITQFDTNMYPKETATFSTPPDRDGSNAILAGRQLDTNGDGIPDTTTDFTGAGDRTMALIDNVRDANYYHFPTATTYIAGFFYSVFNEYMDRNVMTIDAYDWLHRTGPNPPDNPTSDVCTSRPAHPWLYEGTFAHEWQHLLQYYVDPFEVTWLNEGLSDFAQTLVGYVDARLTVEQSGFDSHINCFEGWGNTATPANPNPRDCGGPQDSLNIWDEFENETNGASVLADYGHAYSFLLFLYDRYGTDFISALHSDGAHQGLASVAAELAAEHVDLASVMHDFVAETLLDRIVDKPNGIVIGEQKKNVTSADLNATVNLDNPRSYAAPGAAPNGADYVLLRKANGQPLKGIDLRSLTFAGAPTLPVKPLAWTVVDGAIWSGDADNLDESAIFSATVPATNPTLTFDSKYGFEATFDFGYVEVSTDGGATYTAIPGDQTVDGPLGPALNGGVDLTSGEDMPFTAHTYDLSAYAGQNVLIGFRYVSDPGVTWGGWYVDNVKVGDTLISDGSSLAPFKSLTEVKPVSTHFNVQVWGIDPNRSVAVQVADVDGRNSFSLNLLQTVVLLLFPQVVVTVGYDDPTETVDQYAPYQLTVNGVVQAGGGL